MFVIRNDKENNTVRIIAPAEDYELSLVDVQTGEAFTQQVSGQKSGNYTALSVNGKGLKGGSYMAYFGDKYATMCLCLSVQSKVKEKYR